MIETYPIVSAGWKSLWLFVPLVVVLVSVMVLLGFTIRASRHSRIELSKTEFQLRGDLYGNPIPLTDLLLTEARRLDLTREPDFQPKSRTVGTGMPGYRSGWFRLKNGRKALLSLTDPNRAVLIPTRLGYDVLVSPTDPDALVARLHQLASTR